MVIQQHIPIVMDRSELLRMLQATLQLTSMMQSDG